MKLTKKLRLALFGTLLWCIGFGLLIWQIGWIATVGIFICLWANNIDSDF